MKKIILAMMACAGLCACSSDDIDLAGGSTQKVFDTDVAYVRVNINEVGAGATRANGFAYGTEGTENAVTNAHFYFYDSEGYYITQGEIDDATNWTQSTGTATNVEKSTSDGTDLIILEGLKGNSYPKYVITVLNQPSNFTYANTIDGMMKVLAGTTDGYTDGTNFIMTSSSYKHTSGNYYCVTELNASDFGTSADDALTPVDIFVERLAAKVTVELGTDLSGTTAKIEKVTLGNSLNNDGSAEDEDYTDIYIKFLGWKLNGVANDSYMFKNINTTWDDNSPWTGWNDTGNSRSHWGMSCYYNDGKGSLITEDGADKGKYADLTYVNLSSPNEFGTTPVYCPENTNNTTNSAHAAALTSILIEAQAVTASGSETALNLLEYNGMLFKEDDFYKLISEDYGIYTKVEEVVTELTSDNFTKNDLTVTLNSDTYYDADGNTLSDNEKVSSLQSSGLTLDNYYTDGKMYYNLPIKNLGYDSDKTTQGEGAYGVVRNHYYAVTINSVKSLGIPVNSESDVIIPDDTNPSTTNLLDAKINILSWYKVDLQEDLY